MVQKKSDSKIDGLTGLPNRCAMIDYLENAMVDVAEREIKIALCIVDIDRMHMLNEELGYDAGDQIIVRTAERISNAIQPNDFLARFGSDDFAIVMFYHDFGRVSSTIECILRESSKTMEINGVKWPMSISVGSSVFPECGNSIDDIISMADKAAGKALKAGGNCSIYFDHSMRKNLEKQKWIEAKISSAIEDGQIKPYYQPLINLYDDSIAGFEVLARWPASETGPIFPDEFIGPAEKSGEIGRMTFKLMRDVVKVASEMEEDYVFAVNLSPIQLQDEAVADELISIIESSGLKLSKFEFEVTENTLIKDTKTAHTILEKLRKRGASIGLDDFGAGYSSLQYIRALPFDKIKIDRAYVNEMLTHDGSTIINAVLSLSNALGMATTAEGIEDQETVDMLKALGCERGQGWFYAKAMSEEDMKVFVAQYEADLAAKKLKEKRDEIVAIDMDNLPDLPEEFKEYA